MLFMTSCDPTSMVMQSSRRQRPLRFAVFVVTQLAYRQRLVIGR